jgi:hypothetical protein
MIHSTILCCTFHCGSILAFQWHLAAMKKFLTTIYLYTDQKFHIKIKFMLKYFCNKSTLQLINLAMVQLTMNITLPYKEINSVFFANSNHYCSFICSVHYKKRIKSLKKCRREDDSENRVIKRLRLNSMKH